MFIQVRGVLVHAMSGTELSRGRSEFRLRLPEPINKSPLESRGRPCYAIMWFLGRFHFFGKCINQCSLNSDADSHQYA
jgi:hypothetical protein